MTPIPIVLTRICLRRLATLSPVLLAYLSLALALTVWMASGLQATARAANAPDSARGNGGDLVITATITATATLTPTATTTPTTTPTETETPSPTRSSTSTATFENTPTPTVTPTDTLTPTPTPLPREYLPIIIKPYPTATPTSTSTPTRTPLPPPLLVCDDLPQPLSIPDDDAEGVDASLFVTAAGVVADVNLYLNISHTYVGDLEVILSRPGSDRVTVIDRPGYPASAFGCALDGIVAILDDQMPLAAENKCGGVRPAANAPAVLAISGSFYPTEPLSAFDGESISGEWELKVIDRYPNDIGSLNAWCVEIAFADDQPPTPTPTPVSLPEEAWISGVDGEDQALPLDCESRSAVDWAAYFGAPIDELAFFGDLPESDNPDVGFVGDVHGVWGQIPPNDYGVHAGPVASLLREKGLPALAVRQMKWDDLRAEIAAGRPVIAWVIGSVASSVPVFYNPPDNLTTVVARYEHTVIVVGYSADTVTVLNGAPPYDTYSLSRFLDSWSVLRNMAVIAAP